jgi:hypothetical protein
MEGREMSPTIEEPWSATVKTLPGEPRPRVVTVSKDAGSLHQFVTDLAAANPRATYRVVPVLVVGMEGVQVGDEVRVVTPQGKQASTGYVTEIRDGLAKVRYGTAGGTAEVPVERLEVVSRWVRFPRAGEAR